MASTVGGDSPLLDSIIAVIIILIPWKSEPPMIIVTGASGQLGRAIIQSLVTLLPADRIGATCRDPAKAADLASLGVRVRRADFAEPA